MKYGFNINFIVIIGSLLILSYGCATTSQTSSSNKSKWTAPSKVSLNKVYDAVLAAGPQTGFTVYKKEKDKSGGTILMKKKESSGDKAVANSFFNTKDGSSVDKKIKKTRFKDDEDESVKRSIERRMIVRLKKDKNTITVSTSISLYNEGVTDGILGGVVNKDLTDKFFSNLFLELAIDDPAKQCVVYDDVYKTPKGEKANEKH